MRRRQEGAMPLAEWIRLCREARSLRLSLVSAKPENKNVCETGSGSKLPFPYGNSICLLLSQRRSNTQEDLLQVTMWTFRTPQRGSVPVCGGGNPIQRVLQSLAGGPDPRCPWLSAPGGVRRKCCWMWVPTWQRSQRNLREWGCSLV